MARQKATEVLRSRRSIRIEAIRIRLRPRRCQASPPGSGKTTVMAMVTAWSILNKVADKSNARYSNAVLVVCPNVTIRRRLAELDPNAGEASVYRTRDLTPPDRMPDLRKGMVLIANWHRFELQAPPNAGGARVAKTSVALRTKELVHIGPKNTTARGKRYLTEETITRLRDLGEIEVLEEIRDKTGVLKSVRIESVRYVESETRWIQRVLADLGHKGNLLVLNDEAHHAYRIREDEDEEDEGEDSEDFYKEATVWVEGLDRIHRVKGINFCLDLSATPFFLGRVGRDANRPFPWVVSDFGLIDAVESGLVKVPQLAVRDNTGAAIPHYFNIWTWILSQMSESERGGKKGSVKPEAVLKYAHTPVAMLAGLWQKIFREQQEKSEDLRPPVFILVCKNTAIAKVFFEWLAEDKRPADIPSSGIDEFRNRDGKAVTIRVDSKVVHETDTGEAKSDESRWMRYTLDTVGKLKWPADEQGRPKYPDDEFEPLAKKLERPLDPPGREIRCIVSVGMLTEGWDCNTVTHIVGLRPFQSQLLCEQVVGRGLRRASYDLNANDRFSEEIAKVLGVPFEVVPFKADPGGKGTPPQKRYHVFAVPQKAGYEITFPRVEGYTQAIRNRVVADWGALPPLTLVPGTIPPHVEMKAGLPNNEGRPSLNCPGALESVTLNPFRTGRRMQRLVFEMASALTRDYKSQPKCEVPSHVLFPQLVKIVERYIKNYVEAYYPAEKIDLFLSPYYGWCIENLVQHIHPDTGAGEAPELPRYEANRKAGSTAEVDFWTSREPREIIRSHLNYMVPDTTKWEQSAAYYIDTHERTEAWVKNAGLGFSIPYFHSGRDHDYIPDFIVRLKGKPAVHLILETKGWEKDKDKVKAAAAERWVAAVNADGSYGRWVFRMARKPEEAAKVLSEI